MLFYIFADKKMLKHEWKQRPWFGRKKVLSIGDKMLDANNMLLNYVRKQDHRIRKVGYTMVLDYGTPD